MDTFWMVSTLALWAAVLVMAFLLLGTLRSLGRLNWRLDEMEATRPVRMGRSGLKVGARAPDFTLPDLDGHEVSLADHKGRRVLLVFVQPGCGPCHTVAPELNRLHRSGELDVLVINNGEAEDVRHWAGEVHAAFPVLRQEGWAVAKRYQMYATPFAFLINGQGLIASRGVAGNAQYVGYVLGGEAEMDAESDSASDPESTVDAGPARSQSSREIVHV